MKASSDPSMDPMETQALRYTLPLALVVDVLKSPDVGAGPPNLCHHAVEFKGITKALGAKLTSMVSKGGAWLGTRVSLHPNSTGFKTSGCSRGVKIFRHPMRQRSTSTK